MARSFIADFVTVVADNITLPMLEPPPEPRRRTQEDDQVPLLRIERMFHDGRADLERAAKVRFPGPKYQQRSASGARITQFWSHDQIAAWQADIKALPSTIRRAALAAASGELLPYEEVLGLFADGQLGFARAERLGFPEAASRTLRPSVGGFTLRWRRDRIQEWIAEVDAIVSRLR